MSLMHESVVTLQHLIAADRAHIHEMTQTLERAAARHTTLINRVHLEDQIHHRTKRCDELEDLVREYVEAQQAGRPAEAAHTLVMIQLAAATIVETRNLEAAYGLD
ncbi:hypothetical protein [Nonomuraea sp. NPDC049646]|uniref:hypothetical protein n=1 Tax=unclassified Nonomuraea TaxID=2593643 RepID=UPI00379E707A